MEKTGDVEADFPPQPMVREIATSHVNPFAALLELGDKVSIWDLRSGRRLSQFPSLWDIGGRRLAISEDAKLCCTGAYRQHGVTLYKSSDGDVVWRREDLRKIQNLRFSLHRNAVLAGIDEGPFHVMDASTGTNTETLPGVVDAWENPSGPQIFFEKGSGECEVVDLDSRDTKIIIKLSSFAVLDACFAEDCLAICEAAGPTSLYSLKDGKLVWRYSNPHRRNGKLAYSARTREIVAINASLESGGEMSIVSLDVETGKATRNFPRDDLAIASFALQGSHVITWHGNLVNTTTGDVVNQLPVFPRSMS